MLCDGDTDTKAAIAGSIAEAYYEVPDDMVEQAVSYLPDDMRKVLNQYFDVLQERMGG